jgi:hypothetical protein
MGAPAIDDAVLAPVLAAYALRGARALGRLEASNRNDNLLVIDATGARYVLRRFRRNPDVTREEWAALPMRVARSWLLQPRFYAHLQQDGVDLTTRRRRDVRLRRAVEAERQRFRRSAPTPGAGHAQQDGGTLYPRRTSHPSGADGPHDRLFRHARVGGVWPAAELGR